MNGIGFSVGQAANRVGGISAILIPGSDFGSFVNLSDNGIVVGGFVDVDGVDRVVDGATVLCVTFSAVSLGGAVLGANNVVDDEVSGTCVVSMVTGVLSMVMGVVSMVTDVVYMVTGVVSMVTCMVSMVTAVVSMVTGAIVDKEAMLLSLSRG